MNRFRWLAAALAVSLIVNLVLVGFTAGRFSAKSMHRPPFDPMLGIRAPTRLLSEERREELKPVVRQFREAVPSMRRLRGTQRVLYDAIAADPFEREPLEKALASFRSNLLAGQKAGHAAFVNLVESLTPQERARMLESMRARKRERRRDGQPGAHTRAPLAVMPTPPTTSSFTPDEQDVREFIEGS